MSCNRTVMIGVGDCAVSYESDEKHVKNVTYSIQVYREKFSFMGYSFTTGSYYIMDLYKDSGRKEPWEWMCSVLEVFFYKTAQYII